MFAAALYSTIKEWMIFETDHLYYEMDINVLESSVGVLTPPQVYINHFNQNLEKSLLHIVCSQSGNIN